MVYLRGSLKVILRFPIVVSTNRTAPYTSEGISLGYTLEGMWSYPAQGVSLRLRGPRTPWIGTLTCPYSPGNGCYSASRGPSATYPAETSCRGLYGAYRSRPVLAHIFSAPYTWARPLAPPHRGAALYPRERLRVCGCLLRGGGVVWRIVPSPCPHKRRKTAILMAPLGRTEGAAA